jgi:quinolinate synthase
METLEPVVEIDEKLHIKAAKPLSRMLELAK